MSDPHPFLVLIRQMCHDHRDADYTDGDAPVRIVVPGLFQGRETEGLASVGPDGLIDFRPYTYPRSAAYDRKDRGRVNGVEEFPYHIDPHHVVAVRPADDLPPG